MATKKSSARKKKTVRSAKARKPARKGSARKGSSKKKSPGRTRPAPRRATTRRQSPVARVKRVTREVVQQATGAVTAGVETLRDLGENLVDRVRSDIANRGNPSSS